MVEVEIRGKKFPLCLTVAALDKINEKCGGMKNIGAFIDGKQPDGTHSTDQMICNTAWLLGLLIQEGEESRLVLARFDGEKAERRAVPDSAAVSHLLTVASAKKYRKAVVDAISESMSQEIEALYPKNVKDAERE